MISIVSTLYRSERSIREFVQRTVQTVQRLEVPYEIILVDDGSPDESLRIALEITRSEPHTSIIELSRNFGHHPAMMCGLEHARGSHVFLIDSDLEESPEWLIGFHQEMQITDADVIYGVQSIRRERGLRRLAANLHYLLRRILVDAEYPSDVTTARLMTRAYVDALLRHRETTTPILDLWVTTGFRQIGVPVTKKLLNDSTYDLKARSRLLLSSFVLASRRLLVLSSILGLMTVLASLAAAVSLVLRWAIFQRPSPGWTSVMLAVLFMGGATLLTVSLTGLTVANVANEVRRRPRTIIRRIHGPDA